MTTATASPPTSAAGPITRMVLVAGEMLRPPLLALLDRLRSGLLSWQASDYATRSATEPVFSVVEPGNCWIVTGRHGATLVSLNLAIWDVDAIAADANDETVVATIQSRLVGVPTASPDSFRIYRTHSGVRVIYAHDPLNWDAEPGATLTSPEWFQLVGEALRADPAYMVLCHKQRSCRARLHPKPSRSSGGQHDQARACRFIGGDETTMAPQLAAQVELHDRETRAIYEHSLPLL